MKRIFTILFLLTLAFNRSSAQDISTIAGGVGDGGAATAAILYTPTGMAVDRAGNLYIADQGNRLVRKVTPAGLISVFAGVTGTTTIGGLAVNTSIGIPASVATDTMGNVFISDIGYDRVYKVNTYGVIAILAAVASPVALATDRSGNVYVAQNSLNKILKINSGGTVTTIAGTGTAGLFGDNGPASSAKIDHPTAICLDKYGNLYIADNGNNRVRKIDASGIITTYAGNGGVGYAGDGGPATAANFNKVYGLSVDTSGNLYVAENTSNIIRKIDPAGIVSRYGGTPLTTGFSGDGGPATACKMSGPRATACDPAGNVYVADDLNNRVRKIDAAGSISTVAGSGFYLSSGHSGDGGQAISAVFTYIYGLAFDTSGNMYVADGANNDVRKITPAGIVTTFAGTDAANYTGDGGPATGATMNYPIAIATDRRGNVFISDEENIVIRKVNSAGIISTYAGYSGVTAYSGDGHRADSTLLQATGGIACDKYGNLYIADFYDQKIRKVDTNQIITTVAGTGGSGYFGDGGPATAALLNNPQSIFIDDTGNIIFSETGNHRIRKINSAGIISTIAGNGSVVFSGDGGPALLAGMAPYALTADKSGNIYFESDARIRKISPAGIVTTYAGTGTSGYSGDGGAAQSAKIYGGNPYSMVTDNTGNLYLPDYGRIRKITPSSLLIHTAQDTICTSGGTIIFTATTSVVGAYTPYYHWFRNYMAVGGDSTSYTLTGVANGDVVYCYITNGPGGRTIATSNTIRMAILPVITAPTINISASPSSVCFGSPMTIHATTINGGTAPVYDWYRNHAHVFTGYPYTVTPVAGDTFYCKLTSNAHCLVTDTVNSSNLSYSITASVPTVTVTALPAAAVCVGSTVTVYPHPTNGGSAPVYFWFKNGSPVGTGSTYSFVPDSGDVISCKLISNAPCRTRDTAMADDLTLTTFPRGNPSVSIYVTPNDTVCHGTTVTFGLATSSYGGSSPLYYWYQNGILSTWASTFSFNPQNGDSVYCTLHSASNCLIGVDSGRSNVITLHYSIPDTAKVSVQISPDTAVCEGTPIQCQAITVNGGSNPQFAWYMDGARLGSSTATVTVNPYTGSTIYCRMYNVTGCVFRASDTSETDTFKIIPKSTPATFFNVVPGNIVCYGESVVCYPAGTHAGTDPVFNWYVNNDLVYTGQPFQYTPADGDRIKCEMISNAACLNTQKAVSNQQVYVDSLGEFTISANEGPVIFRGTPVTFSANFTGRYLVEIQYQWMMNGVAVPGATSGTFSPASFNFWDSVYCIATSDTICQGTFVSNTLFIDTHHELRLYPNPNQGSFVINGNDDNANNDDVNIKVYNAIGVVVHEQWAKFDGITLYAPVDLGRKLPPGAYLARVRYGKTRLSLEFSIRY